MFKRALSVLSVVSVVACSSSGTSTTPSVDAGPGGGPVTGAADMHCAGKKQPTDMATCHPADAGTADAASVDAASDAVSDAAGETTEAKPDYGPTMVGTEVDDDDCKYHVKWSITPTHVNEDETVSVTIMRTVDGMPALGADPNLEIFLDETHPAPNSGASATDAGNGSYTIKGVRFDASGKWTLRFHMYESCVDGETSPHGHAAFFVTVP